MSASARTGPTGPAGPAGVPGADGQPRQLQADGVDVPVRSKVDFVGDGVAVTDGPGDKTTVSVQSVGDAADITFTPAGTIAATDVQAAIEEVAAEAGSTAPDASTTVKGIVKLSTAPASAANPIAVADTDPRNSDARTPTSHTHPQSDVTGLAAALAAKQDAATAATDTELASEATARASGDSTNAAAAAAAQATADAALPKVGGTMTGDIVLAGDPTANLHPATRQYVVAQINALINGAPSALDTLKEIADQLASDESAVSALTATVAGKLAASANLSDLANAATARTNLGLGSAATHAASDFDSAGAAAAAQAASQPLDSDLTAIAALATTTFGRSLLILADAAATRTALGLGSAALSAVGDFDAAGAAAAAQAASQPLDSDLTAIAALATTSFGRSLLTQASAAAALTTLGAVATTDSRLSDARTPTAHAASHASAGSDPITIAESQVTNLTTDLAAKAQGLTRTAVKTANYTAAAGDYVPVDTTSGSVTVTLPTAPADKSRVGVKQILRGGTNTVSVACGGSDVFNRSGGSTTLTLTLLAESAMLQYDSGSATWTVQANDAPLSQLDARYAVLASPTFTGTPAAPTAAQGTNTTQLATTAYVQTEAGLLVPKSLIDAKGDLIVGTADNTVARKAIGADGKFLKPKAANSDGLEWGDWFDLGAAPNALSGSPPTLAWWIKASSLALSDGDPVGTWADSSGNSRDVTQATGASKPTYKASRPEFNDKPAVFFNGAHWLQNTATGLSSGSAYTLFVVVRKGAAADQYPIDMRGTNFLDMFTAANLWTLRASGSTIALVGGDVGTVAVMIGVYNGADAWLYQNGRLLCRGAITGSATLTSFFVGANNGTVSFLQGDISDAGLFLGALTAAQIRALTRYYANLYALPIAIPV